MRAVSPTWESNQMEDAAAPSVVVGAIETTEEGETPTTWVTDNTNITEASIVSEFDYSRASLPLDSCAVTLENASYNDEENTAYDFISADVAAALKFPGTIALALGYKYDANDTLLWSVAHGAVVLALATDQDGNVYTGGESAGLENYTTRKYDSTGTLLWSAANGGTVYGIAVDSNGNVYTVGQAVGDTTRKYDSDGVLIWSVDHGADVECIAVDALGNVYTGGSSLSPDGDTTRKYDIDGTEIWSVNHGVGTAVTGIAVDSEGYVYTGGSEAADDVTTRKYDSDGNEIWSVAHGAAVYSIALDMDDFLYTCGARIDDLTTRKYTSDGTLVWSVDHGVDARDIVTDTNYIYVVGMEDAGGITLRKYDTDGTEVWSAAHGADVYCVALNSLNDICIGGYPTTEDITTRKYGRDTETTAMTTQRLQTVEVTEDDLYATFTGIAFLSVLDEGTFYGGRYVPGGIAASTLFAEVLEDAPLPEIAGFSHYTIDSAFDSIMVEIPIPPVSHREALTMLAAYVGAYILPQSDGSISITPTLPTREPIG